MGRLRVTSEPYWERDRERAAASLLKTSSWLTILGSGVYGSLQLYWGTAPERTAAIGFVALLAAAALWLLRLEKLRAAGWLVTSTIFGIGCMSMWFGGGISASGIITMMIVLIMSAMTLEWQPTIAWMFLSVGATSGFTVAESQGWIPPFTPRPLIEQWFVYVFHMAAAAWLVTFSAGAFRGLLGTLGARTVELADSEERYAQLVEQSPDVIVAIDSDGIIVECSRAIETLFGYAPEEVIGHSFRELGVIPEAAFEQNAERFRTLMSGEATALTATQVTHRDGRHRWVEANPRIARHEDGTVRLHLVIRDTTARVEAERRSAEIEQHMVAAGRLEALGRMAGGLAHDFNNLLLVILSNAELLEADSNRTSKPLVEDIRVAGQAAADLTAQLLAFAGQQVQEAETTDVGASLSKIDGLLRRLLPANVRLVVRADPGLPIVRGDPTQLEQVVVNLVMNAQEAMPDGGTITIETSSVHVDEATSRTSPGASSGEHVRIAVTDTGLGMDDATTQRIFEPFFSTRQSGTGLGLATAHGTVKQSGGHIRVHSQRGEGTCFEVLLPHAQPSDAPARAASPQSVAPASSEQQGVVLLVDDEPAVLGSVARLLERHGFRVLAADGPDAARAANDRETGRIDVMVTDVMMPAISGPVLAAELLATRPKMKVILMSGYTEDHVDHDDVLRGTVSFIRKPFSGEQLAKKIRSILFDSDTKRLERA